MDKEINITNSNRSEIRIYHDDRFGQYLRISDLIGTLVDYKDKVQCAQLVEQMLYSVGFVEALCQHLGLGCEADEGTNDSAAMLNKLREGVAHNTDQLHERIIEFHRGVARRALEKAEQANHRVQQLEKAWPKSLEQYMPKTEYVFIGDEELRLIETRIRAGEIS